MGKAVCQYDESLFLLIWKEKFMYFTKMSEEYFPAVIDLEKQSYPEEMRMGMEGLKEEATQPEFFYYSVAGFSKGELVCYIVAYIPQIYAEYHSKQIYIARIFNIYQDYCYSFSGNAKNGTVIRSFFMQK